MISVSQAQSILADYVPHLVRRSVKLEAALGRVCAEDVPAQITRPPVDASAMDGYAVRLEDVRNSGASLKVIGEIPAGSAFAERINAGEAVRIFTGSPLPDGADHIILQERAERYDDSIRIHEASDTPQFVRPAGMDFFTGDIIIPALTRLGPKEIALAAAGNHVKISVLSKPRIAIFAAGDELISPGSARAVGKIVNSNSSALSALINQWGGNISDVGLAKDDTVEIGKMFDSAKGADILVPVGGASVGDYDYMRKVFKQLGGKMIFESVAVKPGKPTWFGLLDDTPVLGLPGNPASAIVCAYLFLRRLMGSPPEEYKKAHLTHTLPHNGPRETYLRAVVSCQNGKLTVRSLPRQDSSLLTPFQEANALLRRLPNAEPGHAGDLAQIINLI